MNKLHYSVSINAPKAKVWAAMLDRESYEAWAVEFSAGSTYEGSWEKGQKIKFLGADGQGMTAVIAENKPFEFVSVKHLGFVMDGIEDTESPEIKAWAPIFENYSFREKDGVTTVTVDIDSMPDMDEYMEQAWPKALARLKQICEQHS